MFETGALQPRTSRNLISTSGFESDFGMPNIRPSCSLLPEVGNPAAFPGILQGTRIQDPEINRQWSKATDAVGRVQPRTSFKSLESWDGRVVEVDAGSRKFAAIVVSDRHPETRETAEFTFDEISDDDQLLVKLGAMFYWSVGYQIDEFGGRVTASILRFKRIRHWTRKELELARERSSKYSDWFVGGADVLDNAASRG